MPTRIVSKVKPGAFIAIMMLLHGMAHADDITDSIKEGLEYYENGEYADAVSSLNYASQLIQQKKGKALETFLPEPLKGWTAQEAASEASAAAMFGGGITAKRQYAKGDSYVSVEIITDSPLLQSVMMMFSNPMFATADGGKMEKIGGQKSIVKYDAAGRSGDVQIVVANRFLVTIEGSGVTRDELTGFGSAIDFKKMAELP